MITQCPNCNKKFKTDSQFEGRKKHCPICSMPFIVQRLKIEQKSSSPLNSAGSITNTMKCSKCSSAITKNNARVLKQKIICKSCLQTIQKETRESMGHIAVYLNYAKIIN